MGRLIVYTLVPVLVALGSQFHVNEAQYAGLAFGMLAGTLLNFLLARCARRAVRGRR